MGRLRALLAIFRLGWHGMTVTNILSYYDTQTKTAVKSFIAEALSVKIIYIIFFLDDAWAK
jgi:hypothetical protein